MPRRDEPLSARPHDTATPPATRTGLSPLNAPAASSRESAADDGRRFARLSDGVKKLRTGGGTLNLGERTLMILGGICAPLGMLLVFLGWYGASHTPNVYEQIPYMISGGLFGLGLVFLGAFFYFTHWVTELVKEHRTQSAALVEAIARLEATVSREAGNDRLAIAKVAGSNGGHVHDYEDEDDDWDDQAWEPDRELVATVKGSMAHRPDCVVVAGKPGLRAVDASEGLLPCKLCDPYAIDDGGQLLS